MYAGTLTGSISRVHVWWWLPGQVAGGGGKGLKERQGGAVVQHVCSPAVPE